MKYHLGVKIDENLNCKQKISDIAIKFNRANTILSKLRIFVDSKTLKPIYHAIFEPPEMNVKIPIFPKTSVRFFAPLEGRGKAQPGV